MTTTNDICHVLRAMQWARAKGELQALLEGYPPGSAGDAEGMLRWQELKAEIERFVEAVEGGELHL